MLGAPIGRLGEQREWHEKVVNIDLINNGVVDGTKAFGVRLANPSVPGSFGLQSSASVTIADDDAYGEVLFSRSRYSVNEDGGAAIVSVIRQLGVAGQISVDYETRTSGTAIEGVDFTSTSGTFNFAPGETEKNFTIPVHNNTTAGGNRTIAVRLQNPVNAQFGFLSMPLSRSWMMRTTIWMPVVLIPLIGPPGLMMRSMPWRCRTMPK